MASKVFGVDLGTTCIKIYQKKEGIIVNQKNMMAVNNENRIIAIGDEAYDMYEKTPENIVVSYPMKGGVIADFSDMQALLTAFVKKNSSGGIRGNYEFYVAVPTNITDVERRAFLDLVESSDLRSKKIHIVEKPIADAVGFGEQVDVKSPRGTMVVDMGGETTEVSVLSLGGIVLSKLILIGGRKLDEDIMLHVKKTKNVIIGMKSAEEAKCQLADATFDLEQGENKQISILGRDLVTGLPVEVQITSAMVYEAIKEHLYGIMDAVKIILERTPPELASDIIENGLFVTGGCSGIQNLKQLILHETDLQANFMSNPADAVIAGLGRIIEEEELKDLAYPMNQTNY